MDAKDIILSLKLAFAFTSIPFSLMGQSTITVTTLDDNTTVDGQVTLREAIQAANGNTSVDGSETGTGADTIVFSAGLNGTITFGSAGLEITETLTIDGDNRITVSGNNVDGIFFLYVSNPGIDLTVKNITLTSFIDSFPPVFEIAGSANGTLTIENSTISNNESNGSAGGAIRIANTASLVVKNSVFSSNTVSSGNSGGALDLASSGSYSIEDSEFTNNSSQNGLGGAINASVGALTINRTIFNGNSADDGGSAIAIGDIGDVNILNSLFFENTTNGTVSGGTIDFLNHSANANIINSTITDNIDNGSINTGGVLADNSDVTLSNTIIANNDGFETTTINGGTFTGSDIGSSGDNIIRDSISGLFVDAANDDYDIQDGSIAVDAGNNTAATNAGLTTDINGNTRIVNSVVDIGAFENQTVGSTTPTVTTASVSTFDATSATLGGNVTADGGASVTDRGIVWNTTGTPDIDNDNVVSIGDGTGAFSQSVGLLPFGTTIHARAFATNSEGTAYGANESFSTGSTVTVNLTSSEGWRLLSVPDDVSLATFLDPIWTQGTTSGGDTGAGIPNVYTWSTSIDGNDQADWQAVTDLTNTTLDGGYGVLVQVYSDDDYDGTPDGFPKTLSVTGSEYASGVSPTMNSNATGWTLLGNPFASAVTFSDLSPANLTGTIYTWDPNDNLGDGGQAGQDTGSWKTWNGSSGDLTGGRIAPFQGFLVQNSTAGSSVSFTQSGKTATATTFLGKENSIPFVRLELQGNGMRNSAWLEFSSDGSTEKINSDAWELTPLSTNYALLATRKADGSLVDIGRYPQASELEIPLVAEATQPGSYTLQVTDFEAPGQTLYLNDLHTAENVRLETGMQYEFVISQAAKTPVDPFAILQGGLKKQADEENRFVISSSVLDNSGTETPQAFALEQNYPNPFNPVTVIRYQLPVNSQIRLELFDMAGRQIATLVNGQKEAGTHSVNFDGSNFSSGVYMYRLQVINAASSGGTGNQIFTKKLTLIK